MSDAPNSYKSLENMIMNGREDGGEEVSDKVNNS